MPCALVLSAGGMFGAYQAGVWNVLSRRFQPDLVVGTSAGALNGWAIAGGCPPAELVDMWRGRARALFPPASGVGPSRRGAQGVVFGGGFPARRTGGHVAGASHRRAD